MFLCLLPSTHPYGCVYTAQKLSIDDKEVTEGARGVCPPAASGAAERGTVLVLEIRAPWLRLFDFLLFYLYFCYILFELLCFHFWI